MTARKLITLIAATIVVFTGARHFETTFGQPGFAQDPPAASTPSIPGRWTGTVPSRNQIRAALRKVTVQDRATVPGYDRGCGAGHACVFGPAWTDDTPAAMGRNGCDQRNDMLRSSMTAVELRPNTNGCVVEAGILQDPYTGATIHFTKAQAHEVHVDHVYPLALAWDQGAAGWSLEQRIRFATDPINLIAVDGASNSSKGDRGPGEWMPINRAYRCTYVHRFVTVAVAYQLPITAADRSSIAHTAATCPRKPGTVHN